MLTDCLPTILREHQGPFLLTGPLQTMIREHQRPFLLTGPLPTMLREHQGPFLLTEVCSIRFIYGVESQFHTREMRFLKINV